MNLLNEILVSNHWKINNSPGDGHCLLHSVVSSYSSQLPGLPAPTLNFLKNSIIDHVHSSSAEYSIYGMSSLKMVEEMEKYIYDRVFNLDFVDLAPLIIARLLKINILILDTDHLGCVTKHFLEPPIATTNTISLQRRGDHYNGIIALWRDLYPMAPPAPIYEKQDIDDIVSNPVRTESSEPSCLQYTRQSLLDIRGTMTYDQSQCKKDTPLVWNLGTAPWM